MTKQPHAKQKISLVLYGEEADLARQFQAAAGISLPDITRLAIMRYIWDTLGKAEELEKQVGKSALVQEPEISDESNPGS